MCVSEWLSYIYRLKRERDSFICKINELERLIDTAAINIERLKEENEKLKGENGCFRERVKDLTYQLKVMRGKIFKRNVKREINIKRVDIEASEEGKELKLRGAPPVHRGSGRVKPDTIDEFIDIYPERCSKCGGKIEKVDEDIYDSQIVSDVEIVKRVKCLRYHYGYCKSCPSTVYPHRSSVISHSKGAVCKYERIGGNVRAIAGYFLDMWAFLTERYKRYSEISLNSILHIHQYLTLIKNRLIMERPPLK